MTLEKRIFLVEQEARSPSENMAINSFYRQLVTGECDVIVRVYRHKKGVILGTNQSLKDVNKKNCSQLGYEITRRMTGGAAVVVDPSVYCFSVFCKRTLFQTSDIHELYKTLLIPLAKHMGNQFSVSGTFYIKTDNKPVIGNALKEQRDTVQLDGMAHLVTPTVEIVDQLIQLRTLYEIDKQKYVHINEGTYKIKGLRLIPENIDLSHATFLRDEKQEIANLPSLQDLGYTADKLTEKLYNAMQDVFGQLKKSDIISTNHPQIEPLVERKGMKVAIGHCFIYIGEVEDNRVFYSSED